MYRFLYFIVFIGFVFLYFYFTERYHYLFKCVSSSSYLLCLLHLSCTWCMGSAIQIQMDYYYYYYIIKRRIKSAPAAGWPHHVTCVVLQVPGLLLWGVWGGLHARRPPGSDPQQWPQRRGRPGERAGSANQLQGTGAGCNTSAGQEPFITSSDPSLVFTIVSILSDSNEKNSFLCIPTVKRNPGLIWKVF